MVGSILPLELREAVVRRRGKRLLGPVDLTVGAKGFTIVMGPNGSGKTTLMRSLHGLQRLTEGEAVWAAGMEAVRKRQAYVFQQPVMMRRSVRDNLAYPLLLHGTKKAAARMAAEEWAARIDLTEALDRRATQLSGGERQKLALARALIREPELLFLDEPCANLDGRATRDIEALLKVEHERGTRIVMATHDMGQARRLATDIVFLLNGKIHETGPAEPFFAGPATPEAGAFLKGDIV